jgi:hypothetical protein
MRTIPDTEQDLAETIKLYFSGQPGVEIYQEVQPFSGYRRADLVIKHGSIIHVIECKLSYGAAVLEQAWAWRPAANYVSVAVPKWERARRSHVVFNHFCDSHGIGVYLVTERALHGDGWAGRVVVGREPKLRRRRLDWFEKCLREEHKYWVDAGTKAGHFTAFAGTVKVFKEWIQTHPGCTIKQAIEGIHHHYQCDVTARGALAQHIRNGVIDGITMDTTQKPCRLYMVAKGREEE